jgi:mRNA interferase RelE/StbE
VVYSLEFHPGALAEFKSLDKSVSSVLLRRLEERLFSPRVPADRLSGSLSNCYKIRNGKTGHRLVYQVLDEEMILFVIAVGKRADKAVYLSATERI